jgi:hypothetical protein
MYRKNTASQYVYFCLVNPTTGVALTGATVTAYRALDNGAQASATGTTTELANGQYRFNLSQADTDGDYGSYLFTATNAVPVEKTVVFTQANPQDAAGFGLSRLDQTVGSRMATYTQPTGFLAADFTRLDATVSSRMATYTQPTGFLAANFGNLDAAVSSRMATYTQPTGFLAATFPTTVASTTNITSASGVTLAAVTHTGAVIPTVTSVTNAVTAGTVSDKTGYSLVAGTGLGNQTANITGNLSGSVGSVTGNVGGNVVGSVGSVTAAVTVGTNNDKTGYSLSVAPLTAAQTASAVWDALLTSYTVAGSFGARVVRSTNSNNSVQVTGSNHVAADIHELQAGVITAGKFAAGAINANALAADAASEIAVAVAATQALSRLDSMIESDGAGEFRFDTIALSMAPAGGGGGGTDWTTNERTAIRSILGFDSGGTVSLPTVGVLDAIKDKTDLITVGQVQYTSPVSPIGNIATPIFAGDDYKASIGNAFTWTINARTGYSVSTATCRFGGSSEDTGDSWNVSGTVSDLGGGEWQLSFDLPKATTSTLSPGFYRWSVELSNPGGDEVTEVYNSNANRQVEVRAKQT